MSAPVLDLYQTVTNQIIAALEAGTPPWSPPWLDGTDWTPRNLTSRRPYRGINVLVLNIVAATQGYPDHRWLTFRQAGELGAHVRKGERGTPIVFFKMTEVGQSVDEAATATSSTKVVPLLRSFIVFNTAQIDGLPERLQRKPQIPWDPCDEAETLIAASGACLRHGGDRACYVPAEDVIQVPPQARFPDAESYYATALHELTHWSGRANRCNRPLGMRHGIEAYAFEELVAEMGSAFLSAHCGLTARIEHASYVESWLRALRQDKRLIFVAASKAQAAADFLLRFSESLPGPVSAVAACA